MAQVTQNGTEQLARYLKHLEKEDMINFNIIGDGEHHVQNRIRIQNFVFLAKRFGLDLPFGFDGHANGPNSESLAEQCNTLAENRQELYDPVQPDLPLDFNSSGFLDFVRYQSTGWLELVSTMVDLHDSGRCKDRDALVDKVSDIKYKFSREYVDDVLTAAEFAGLVRLPT